MGVVKTTTVKAIFKIGDNRFTSAKVKKNEGKLKLEFRTTSPTAQPVNYWINMESKMESIALSKTQQTLYVSTILTKMFGPVEAEKEVIIAVKGDKVSLLAIYKSISKNM